MTVIRASCPGCGEVDLTETDVELVVCSYAPLSYWAFDCPGCGDRTRRRADDHVISLLMTGGVKATRWDVPGEALEPHAGPRLDYDDLLDLLTAMSASDLLSPLALAELAGR